MSRLNDLFGNNNNNRITSRKYNPLQIKKMVKKTENDDDTFNTTGNKLLDLFFMTEYYQKHLNEISIGTTDKEKLFSMFIRDPRHGIGRRDMGRILMEQSGVSPEDVLLAGRADDLLYIGTDDMIDYLYERLMKKDELVKKWLPRLTSKKDSDVAKYLAKRWFLKPGMKAESAYRLYRKAIKVKTVEHLMSEKRDDEIKFENVPSLAMVKYFSAFKRKQPERFDEYLRSVKSGEKKLNISTTNVYDIYKNREIIDAQLFFDKLEKIKISCVPIVDTSGSMWDANDSIGKALSIGHYLAKCSTYCPNQVVAFSSNPHLIDLGKTRPAYGGFSLYFDEGFERDAFASDYINEINSMITGDCSNTDFGKVIDLLGRLDKDYPDYFVVLSDMEFDKGSNARKSDVMNMFKSKGVETKIIWFNFNSRNKTAPELDEYGNVFISGYNPMILKYLESGFDGEKFLNKLLNEYAKKIGK